MLLVLMLVFDDDDHHHHDGGGGGDGGGVLPLGLLLIITLDKITGLCAVNKGTSLPTVSIQTYIQIEKQGKRPVF